MTELAPIRREVRVHADPEAAFAVFTDDIGLWWPVESFSVHGADSTVAFEYGRIVERSVDGAEATWGTVLTWEPGRFVRFTWHPGGEPDVATTVSVSFRGDAGGTLVVLEHAGWEALAEPAVRRDEYGQGWPVVLERYGHHAGLDPTSD